MSENNDSKAYISGLADGAEAVRDLVLEHRDCDPEERLDADEILDTVESWFADGTVDPDNALINACTDDQLAEVLGLDVDQVEERGQAFHDAIELYNKGFRTGARQEAKGSVASRPGAASRSVS